MERLQEYLADPTQSLGMGADEARDLLENDFSENEQAVQESVFTDDPVRVYLREMGTVRLLSRQGEIDLAKGMERGKLRMRKALSRFPIVWQRVLALNESLRSGQERLDDFVELTGSDETARERTRGDVMRRLGNFAKLHGNLVELERKIASTPERYVNVRSKLMSRAARLKVRCSQAVRSIPFHQAQWRQLRAAVEDATRELERVERAFAQERDNLASKRQLRRRLREL